MFNELPRAEVGRLETSLPLIQLRPGEALFRQGDRGDAFYIVRAGRLEAILAMSTPDERVLAAFGVGDFVGEMSLLELEGHRAASVRATADSQLWMVTRQTFNELLHRFPLMAYSLVQVISRRLSLSNDAAFRDLQRKNSELQRAYDELKAAHVQIVEKERLEHELQLARKIQMSILPHSLPHPTGYDFGGLVEPAREVGGDFYDVIPLDEHTESVFIGDVADKGAAAALFMARTHALLTAEATKGAAPQEVLSRVNSHLTRMERSDLFVTVLYGLLDRRTRRFSYARAGHEIPLIVHADGCVQRMPYERGQVIGILEEIVLDRQEVQLPPGSTLLIYTDGMTDGRNPQGEMFGLERLREALVGLAGRAGQEVCQALLRAMSLHRGAAPQDDDITLLAIHAQ